MKWIGKYLRLKEILSQFDGMVWELKEVRYVPQTKRNLISVGVLKTWVLNYLLKIVSLRWLEAWWWCWKAFDAIVYTTWRVAGYRVSGDFKKFKWSLHPNLAFETLTCKRKIFTSSCKVRFTERQKRCHIFASTISQLSRPKAEEVPYIQNLKTPQI